MIGNSKFEYRNPKQIQNSNFQIKERYYLLWSFGFWTLVLVSNFGFRASDLNS
jgi:hypothetical protein